MKLMTIQFEGLREANDVERASRLLFKQQTQANLTPPWLVACGDTDLVAASTRPLSNLELQSIAVLESAAEQVRKSLRKIDGGFLKKKWTLGKTKAQVVDTSFLVATTKVIFDHRDDNGYVLQVFDLGSHKQLWGRFGHPHWGLDLAILRGISADTFFRLHPKGEVMFLGEYDIGWSGRRRAIYRLHDGMLLWSTP